MKTIGVVFPNSNRIYTYKTELELIPNAFYDIIVEGNHSYDSFVKVIGNIKSEYSGYIKTITAAKLIDIPPKKDGGIKNVYINKAKGAFTVVWKDNVSTTVRLQNGDTFDEEKAILACYVKRTFENRGYYNDIIKDALKSAIRI